MLIATTAACGDGVEDNSPVTRYEVAEELGDAWCRSLERCGIYDEEDMERCIRHNVSHLCELDDTCGDEVEETREELNTCVSDIEIHGCHYLRFGSAPDSCLRFFD